MYWEHIIRVDRTITAQINQAERHVILLTVANLSAELLHLFCCSDRCSDSCMAQTQVVDFKAILRLKAVSSSKAQRHFSHLSPRLDHIFWTANHGNSNLSKCVWSVWILRHMGRKYVCWKPSRSTLLPHYNSGVFLCCDNGRDSTCNQFV